MLYSYDELSIGFESLGALEVSINFQTSDIRLWLQSSYQKTQPTLLALFYAVFRHQSCYTVH